jgi:hypothetical protein
VVTAVPPNGVVMGYNDIFMQIVVAGHISPPPSAVANYLPFRIVGN